MRRLAVIEFVTLVGVMRGLGSADEDRDGGFEYGGWGAAHGDDVVFEVTVLAAFGAGLKRLRKGLALLRAEAQREAG